jgi:hypothetical protein
MHSRVEKAVIDHSGRNLRVVKIIHESRSSVVSLVSDERGQKFALKAYLRDEAARLVKERDFLLKADREALHALHLPKVHEAGQDYLLLEFIGREALDRETVLQRGWSDEEVQLWVRALLEFQSLKPERRLFTLRERLLGWAYPVVRTIVQWRDYDAGLRIGEKIRIAAMLVAYLALRPFFRNVCTHYDLQTTNYTFAKDRRQMSMVDCGFSYYMGDPYFDVIYYATIPVTRITEWTIQPRLLARFLRESAGRPRTNHGKYMRIRLILLSCNLGRYLHFRGDSEKQHVYADNVRSLLDRDGFAAIRNQLREMSETTETSRGARHAMR